MRRMLNCGDYGARRYGPCYVETLVEVGFSVKVTSAFDLLHRDEAIRIGINSAAGEIYCCAKQRALFNHLRRADLTKRGSCEINDSV